MKICSEISLKDFEFWGGAVDTRDYLSDEDMDRIEQTMEYNAPEEGYYDSFINEVFWLERDTIAAWLGYSNWEELERDRDGLDEDEDDDYPTCDNCKHLKAHFWEFPCNSCLRLEDNHWEHK